MSEKTDNFIKTVGTLARNEYLSREKWILPSVCIAQGALESGWNLNAKTLFGIKGTGFTATTSEYYNGHYVEIEDSFRSYPNVASAVVGYYDFLRDTPRYCNALNNSDYRDAVDKLIHTTDGAPYATDPEYINKIISIIEQYNLADIVRVCRISKPICCVDKLIYCILVVRIVKSLCISRCICQEIIIAHYRRCYIRICSKACLNSNLVTIVILACTCSKSLALNTKKCLCV